MAKQAWIKLAIVAIVAAPLFAVVFSQYSFRLESSWRMDPIPFAFFVASAYFAGRLGGLRAGRKR